MPAKAKKSEKRVKVVDGIVACLRDPKCIAQIGFRTKPEAVIQQSLFHQLQKELRRIYRELEPGLLPETYERKAEQSLLWEGDKTTVINMLQFLGTQHRPDFELTLDHTRIAIEVKRGDTGSAIREGIGQSLVYAHKYDFVVYAFYDTTAEGRVSRSVEQPGERAFIDDLWDHHNVRFEVI